MVKSGCVAAAMKGKGDVIMAVVASQDDCVGDMMRLRKWCVCVPLDLPTLEVGRRKGDMITTYEFHGGHGDVCVGKL